MINYLNNKNNLDFIHQFQYIKPYNKPKLKGIYIDNNNNEIIKKNAIIYNTYYNLLITFNQKPLIKFYTKSIASFNIKPNMPYGTHMNLINNIYIKNTLFYNIIPILGNDLPGVLKMPNYLYKNNKYNLTVNFGITGQEDYLKNVKGGANIIYQIESPVKYLPFFYI